jgi:hypothetical protein
VVVGAPRLGGRWMSRRDAKRRPGSPRTRGRPPKPPSRRPGPTSVSPRVIASSYRTGNR